MLWRARRKTLRLKGENVMEQRDFAQVVLAECAELLEAGDLTLDETGYCALVSEQEDVLHIKLDASV